MACSYTLCLEELPKIKVRFKSQIRKRVNGSTIIAELFRKPAKLADRLTR